MILKQKHQFLKNIKIKQQNRQENIQTKRNSSLFAESVQEDEMSE